MEKLGPLETLTSPITPQYLCSYLALKLNVAPYILESIYLLYPSNSRLYPEQDRLLPVYKSIHVWLDSIFPEKHVGPKRWTAKWCPPYGTNTVNLFTPSGFDKCPPFTNSDEPIWSALKFSTDLSNQRILFSSLPDGLVRVDVQHLQGGSRCFWTTSDHSIETVADHIKSEFEKIIK